MDPKDQKPTTDYCETKTCADEAPLAPTRMGWKELYHEGGLVGYLAWVGHSRGRIPVFCRRLQLQMDRYTTSQMVYFWPVLESISHGHISQYVAQFIMWGVIFSVSLRCVGI